MSKSVAACFLASILLAGPASAAPSDADVEELLRPFGLQIRGFAAASSNFDDAIGGGGDADVVIGGSRFELLLGGRFGSGGAKTEIGAFDVGFRTFLDRGQDPGMFVQGGVLVGAQLADGFGLETGSLTALSGEAGIEWPHAARHRLTTSVRIDAGRVHHAAQSRIVPDPTFAMASLNLGFVVGAR
jgi:hypothetical protein